MLWKMEQGIKGNGVCVFRVDQCSKLWSVWAVAMCVCVCMYVSVCVCVCMYVFIWHHKCVSSVWAEWFGVVGFALVACCLWLSFNGIPLLH